ncbi:MAG: caspase family protein [Candidatus Obscuribacterales bacterium]|nr:caspase family protein [Candidatus Obscuribacterales bacterium]
MMIRNARQWSQVQTCLLSISLVLLLNPVLNVNVCAAESESELTQKVVEWENKLRSADSYTKKSTETCLAYALNSRSDFYNEHAKTDLAEADLNRAVQLDSALGLPWRARFYMKTGKTELAEADWNRAVELEPKKNLADRAKFYEKGKKTELAEADWNRAVQLQPEYYLDDRAEFYEKIGKWELAEADRNRAVQLKPEDSYNRSDRARLYEKLGKFDLAEADWNHAVQLRPEDRLQSRAAFYEKIGKMELAEADLNRAVQLKPEENLRVRSSFYERIGKLDLAEADLNRAVQLKYDEYDYYRRAKFYEKRGNLELAEADMNRAVQLDPKSRLDARAGFYENVGKLSLAEADLIRYSSLNVENSSGLLNLARFYEQTGKNELAEANFNRAVQLFCKSEYHAGYSYSARARYYEKRGKTELAEADWNRAVELKHDSSYVSQRAEFYERLGKFDLALHDLDSIYVDGRSACALQRALLLLRMGKKELAERDLKEIVSLRPKGYEPESLTLAKCYLVLGQPNLAVDCLSKFRQLTSDREWVLSIANDRMNKRKEAADLYSKFLEKRHDSAKSYQSAAQECEYARQRLIALGVKPAYGPFPLASNCKQPLAETLQLSSAPMVASASSSSRPAPSAAQPHSIDATEIKPSTKTIRDKWALVVGVSKFHDKRIPQLRYSAKDARDFRDFLVKEANFAPDHVRLLLDEKATERRVMSELGNKFLARVAKPDDLIVLFFSTHGSSAKADIRGKNYIVAYDSDRDDLYTTGIEMQKIVESIDDRVISGRTLLVLDACHSGATTNGAKAMGDGGNFDAQELAQGSGKLVICSSQPDQISWESTRYQNGIFTRKLLEGFRSNGKNTKLGDAFNVLRSAVRSEAQEDHAAKQEPVLKSKWDGNDLLLCAPPSAPQALPAAVKQILEPDSSSALAPPLPPTTTQKRPTRTPLRK